MPKEKENIFSVPRTGTNTYDDLPAHAQRHRTWLKFHETSIEYYYLLHAPTTFYLRTTISSHLIVCQAFFNLCGTKFCFVSCEQHFCASVRNAIHLVNGPVHSYTTMESYYHHLRTNGSQENACGAIATRICSQPSV